MPTSASARDMSVFLATTISLPLGPQLAPQILQLLDRQAAILGDDHGLAALELFDVLRNQFALLLTCNSQEASSFHHNLGSGRLPGYLCISTANKKPLYRRQQAQRLHTPNGVTQ